jgi:hypothetical protein
MAPRSATTSSGPAPGTSAPTLEPRPHRLCHAPGTSSGANARREHTLHFTTIHVFTMLPHTQPTVPRVPSDRAAFRPTSLEGSHLGEMRMKPVQGGGHVASRGVYSRQGVLSLYGRNDTRTMSLVERLLTGCYSRYICYKNNSLSLLLLFSAG